MSSLAQCSISTTTFLYGLTPVGMQSSTALCKDFLKWSRLALCCVFSKALGGFEPPWLRPLMVEVVSDDSGRKTCMWDSRRS